MSDNKVTLDQLDNSAVEAMVGSIGDVNELNTENKTIVGALVEIVGKKEIANAIGEPLAETDKFSEMSSEINGLLSTFKTNMMNAGVVVESGDKFKQLIDKIQGLTEGEGNKGVKYAEGNGNWSVGSIGDNSGNHTVTIETNLDFTPTIIICYVGNVKFYTYDTVKQTYNKAFLSNTIGISGGSMGMSVTIRNIKPESFDIVTTGTISGQAHSVLASGITNWYAIGVGEEDTTLRDSLASILQEEGVDVTEEDDIASLISKVDEEFGNKNNEMENIKHDLIDILTNRGVSVEEGLTTEELVDKIDEETKLELKAGTTGTYLVTLVSSTVRTDASGTEKTINGTINFNKNKLRITGASISYSTSCYDGATEDCYTSLVQYRNGNAIKTHFSVNGKTTNDFGKWSGTVTDIQYGDIFKLVTRQDQRANTTLRIDHTLKITCVINI
jgi:hypothetical protein